MPRTPENFDFWYALANTELVETPSASLETFGTTLLNYRLLTEPMDSVSRVRVREGRMQALRPEILTPDAFSGSPLEGFQSPDAEEFVQWLKTHAADISILRYGFRIRHETIRETLLTDSLEAVLDRVKDELRLHPDPLAAIVVGVEEPWEVSLLKLLFAVVRHSAAANARDLRADPDGSRHEIEAAFRAAARDRSRLPALAALLQRHRCFERYQDRFFALVRR